LLRASKCSRFICAGIVIIGTTRIDVIVLILITAMDTVTHHLYSYPLALVITVATISVAIISVAMAGTTAITEFAERAWTREPSGERWPYTQDVALCCVAKAASYQAVDLI
jgi:hypothetical protein